MSQLYCTYQTRKSQHTSRTLVNQLCREFISLLLLVILLSFFLFPYDYFNIIRTAKSCNGVSKFVERHSGHLEFSPIEYLARITTGSPRFLTLGASCHSRQPERKRGREKGKREKGRNVSHSCVLSSPRNSLSARIIFIRSPLTSIPPPSHLTLPHLPSLRNGPITKRNAPKNHVDHSHASILATRHVRTIVDRTEDISRIHSITKSLTLHSPPHPRHVVLATAKVDHRRRRSRPRSIFDARRRTIRARTSAHRRFVSSVCLVVASRSCVTLDEGTGVAFFRLIAENHSFDVIGSAHHLIPRIESRQTRVDVCVLVFLQRERKWERIIARYQIDIDRSSSGSLVSLIDATFVVSCRPSRATRMGT